VNGAGHAGGVDGVWPFAGRDALLARVTEALRSRSTRMVVLTGEGGVGKTRLSTGAVSAVEADGDLVILLYGNPMLSAVPLGVAGALVPEGVGSDDPTALFEAVRAHLVSLAAGRRIVLQAESAALLDPVTIALLGQLVGVRTATLIATIRTGDPLPDALSSSWSPDDCSRFEVPPLTPAQTGDVLQAALGGPVAWHVTDELHAACGGNPLYLRELVIGAFAAQRLAFVAGAWQLTGDPVPTPALRELVLAQVRRLDDAARDVVERLAVCGMLPVTHLPGATARAALAMLEQTGLVVVAPGQGGLTARLGQQQYASVVREGLSVLRVAEIAAEQADRLEADGHPDDVLRIALWRLDAGVTVDDGTLLDAAELAHFARDHRTVERLTAAASPRGAASARLLLLRGTALTRRGRLSEALAALQAAAESAGGGDPALILQIATATAFAHASFVDGTPAALAVLDALPPDLAAGPGVALMRATLALYEHRVDDARRILDAVAPEFAGSAVDRGVHAHALAPVLSAQGDDERALDAAVLALEQARIADGSAAWPIPVAAVECTHAEVLLQAGQLVPAFDAAIRALRLATAGDDQFVTRYIEFVLGRIELERGRLEAAARWFREVAGGALARGPISLVGPAAGALAIVRASQGDHTGAAEALALVPDGTPHRNPTGILAAAIAKASAGELGAAADILITAARDLEESGYAFLAGIQLFALARWGDARAAAAGLERLVAKGAGEFTALQARHGRAEASGDRAELTRVAEEWEQRGAVLYAAEALASAARLAQAAGESRAATGLQARSDALAGLSQGAATPLLRFTASLVPLTAREREIAALAAQGSSSKEIADRLFLSARTVDNHLQSIYGKLGIRGRRELADAIG
jgi:DNA-binding CsgD family transcriptional regulator